MQGNPDDALALLRDSAAEFPGHFDTLWGIARALAATGQVDEAKQAYTALLESPNLRPDTKSPIERELADLNSPSQ